MRPRHVSRHQLDDMAMVQLAHRQPFLAQVFDCQATAAHDALPSEANGSMCHFVYTAKGAAAEVVEMGETGIESFCFRAVEVWFVPGRGWICLS